MPWTVYNPGSGPVAPVFPRPDRRYVAGIPLDGRGNVFTPKRFRGEGSQRVTRPGTGGTLTGAGGNRKLKFA